MVKGTEENLDYADEPTYLQLFSELEDYATFFFTLPNSNL